MNIVRFDPFREMATLQDRVNRIFADAYRGSTDSDDLVTRGAWVPPVDIYENDKIVKHEGAWLAGVNGAKFGLLMPGTPLIGGRHYQEIAPAVAHGTSPEAQPRCPVGGDDLRPLVGQKT